MTVRSTRLAAVHFTTTGGHLVYTCPTGWRTILKSISGDTVAGTTGELDIYLQTAGGAVTQYLELLTQAAGTNFTWSGWVVMNPSDNLYAYNAQQPVTLWVSGTLLQLTGQEPL